MRADHVVALDELVAQRGADMQDDQAVGELGQPACAR